MAKIIEFMGPQGVGKSTTIKHIAQILKLKNGVVLADSQIHNKTLFDRIKNKFIKKQVIQFYNKKKYLDFFEQKYSSFVEIYWHKVIEKYNNRALSFKIDRLRYTYETMSYMEYLRDLDFVKYIIVDEGVFMRSFDIIYKLKYDTETFGYFEKMINMPDVVVYFKTNHEIVYNRIYNRTKLEFGRELNLEEMELVKVEVEIQVRLYNFLFENIKTKVPYIVVDSSDDVVKNAVIIKEFILTL